MKLSSFRTFKVTTKRLIHGFFYTPVIPACPLTRPLWAVLILKFLWSCYQRWQRWMDSFFRLTGIGNEKSHLCKQRRWRHLWKSEWNLLHQKPSHESSPQIPLLYGLWYCEFICWTWKVKTIEAIVQEQQVHWWIFISRRRYRTWQRHSEEAWKIRITYVWRKSNALHIHQQFVVQHLLSKGRKDIFWLATSLSQRAYTT